MSSLIKTRRDPTAKGIQVPYGQMAPHKPTPAKITPEGTNAAVGSQSGGGG